MSKPVSYSAVKDSPYKIFPNDLNSFNTVFGGLVMSLCDRAASVVAEVHSEKVCVTASVDAMNFLAPAKAGEVLLISASINRTWRTSMEVGVRVDSVNYRAGSKEHIVSAYFTFVALGEDKRPTEVPAVVPETPEQIRRYDEAEHRRQARKKYAEESNKRKKASDPDISI